MGVGGGAAAVMPSEPCDFCSLERELKEHLSFSCRVTKTLWQEVLARARIRRMIISWGSESLWILEVEGRSPNSNCTTTLLVSLLILL